MEKVGTYDPKSKQRVLDVERIKYWISVGAQPSATVHNMLVSLKIIDAKKINVLPKFKEPAPAVEDSGEAKKEEVAAEAAPAAEAPAEAAAPVEEVAVVEETKEETPAA